MCTAAKTPAAAAVKKHMIPDQPALGDPIVNSIGMTLLPIPAGEFLMGSAYEHEGPQHLVKITKPFYLSEYVVTQQQYEEVMGLHPWLGWFGVVLQNVQKGPDYPATYVSWNRAVEFCRKLSELEGVEYRLPTEAQWEYACRAGTTTLYSFGDDVSELGRSYAHYEVGSGMTKAELVCYSEDHDKPPDPVGSRLPNPWGLYDMHGSVWEWCQD